MCIYRPPPFVDVSQLALSLASAVGSECPFHLVLDLVCYISLLRVASLEYSSDPSARSR